MAGADEDLFGAENGGEGPDQCTPSSPFRGARTDAERAKIGRPAGARNRKSEAFERWYHAMGYTDPLQRLAELVTEDPRVLQTWLDEHAGRDAEGAKRPGPTVLEVLRLQIAAAGELAPYLHGKKPIAVAVTNEALPMLVIRGDLNQLDQVRELEAQRALAVGAPLVEGEASEINDLEDEA